MDKNELMEIKRRWKIQEATFSGFSYSIFSTEEGVILKADSKSFYSLSEDECFKYLSFLGKGYSTAKTVYYDTLKASGDLLSCLDGVLSGSNSVELLSALALELSKGCGAGYYALLSFTDSYDIPIKDASKTKTGESDLVYTYNAYLLCPIKPVRGGIVFEDDDLTLSKAVPYLQAPTLGMLYPAFTDRLPDAGNVFVCAKTESERRLVSSLFDVDVPRKPSPVAVIKDTRNIPSDTAPVDENMTVPDADSGYPVSENAYITPSGGIDYDDERDVEKMGTVQNNAVQGDIDRFLDGLEEKRASARQSPAGHRISDVVDSSDGFHDLSTVKGDGARAGLSDDITVRSVGGRDYYIIPADRIPLEVLERLMAEAE